MHGWGGRVPVAGKCLEGGRGGTVWLRVKFGDADIRPHWIVGHFRPKADVQQSICSDTKSLANMLFFQRRHQEEAALRFEYQRIRRSNTIWASSLTAAFCPNGQIGIFDHH